MQTPSIFNRGLAYFGAAVIGGAMTIAGLLSVANVSVSGTVTAANAVLTSATATNLAVGSGPQLNVMGSAAVSLDFPAILGGQCVGRTMTVTGASTSTSLLSSVSVGVPTAIIASATATSWYGYASAPNVVTVVGCNNSVIQQPDQSAATFRATVFGFTQ